MFLCFIFPVAGITQYAALFQSDSILKITLSTNMNELLNDRGDDPKYHPMIISYSNDTGKEFFISAEVKTRGHFRKLKENCLYPPLLLHFFKNDTLQSSVFKDQEKLKLVMPCRGNDYVLYEWMVYKLYNIITPKSFKARLVSITIADNKKNKTVEPLYGILLEDENQMAARNDEIVVEKKMRPQDAQKDNFLKMAVFQYLIGNTDWSIQYLQNIKLIAHDSAQIPTAVPYDFDHAGIVNAPYAKPAEELEMSSVKQRRYRGYCMQDMKEFDSTIALYNNVKPAVYALYTNCSVLNARYVKTTIKFLDDFYKTINDPAAFKKEFSYPCDKNGTGNVIIKGLKD
jgi:hypothetical protein